MHVPLRPAPAPTSLEQRLVWALGLLCAALVAALAWMEWTVRATVIRTAERTHANLAASVADHAGQVLRRADDVLGTLLAQITELPLQPADEARLRGVLLRHTGMDGVLVDVQVFDAAGRLVLSSFDRDRDGGGERVAALPFFRQHLASTRDSALLGEAVVTGEGRRVVPMSRRLSDARQRFVGVVVAVVDVDRLTEDLQRLDTGQEGLVALLSADGTLIAGLGRGAATSASGRDLSGSSLFREHVGTTARGSVAAAWPLSGVPGLYSFERSPRYPVTAVAGNSLDDVLAGWRSRAWRVAVVVLALLVAIVALCRRILRAQARQRELTVELKRSHLHLADLERAVREHAVVAVTDVRGTIVSVNDKFCELSQYSAEELVGQTHRVVNSGLHPPAFFKELWRTVAQGGVWKGQIANRRKDGSVYYLESTIVPIRRDNGRPERYIAIRTDVTELRRLAEELGRAKKELERANLELEDLAATDPLTLLANRRRFDAGLRDECRRARRGGLPLGRLLVDVDCFKSFNDTYGHPAGDECLRRVAAVLARAEGRPGDLAARWGGEEFAILLPATDGPGALVVAERVRQAVIDLRIRHEHGPAGHVTVSIGIASLDPAAAGGSPEALVEGADAALYRAKREGRNRCALGPVPEGLAMGACSA